MLFYPKVEWSTSRRVYGMDDSWEHPVGRAHICKRANERTHTRSVHAHFNLMHIRRYHTHTRTAPSTHTLMRVWVEGAVRVWVWYLRMCIRLKCACTLRVCVRSFALLQICARPTGCSHESSIPYTLRDVLHSTLG